MPMLNIKIARPAVKDSVESHENRLGLASPAAAAMIVQTGKRLAKIFDTFRYSWNQSACVWFGAESLAARDFVRTPFFLKEEGDVLPLEAGGKE
mmetsp:Transcript_2572/g.4205  ORF Transcript_2572/g.4205 Transcript_2572/m.4205 type:complete len:94 (-) Transcript_2572:457-738(-)